MELASTLYHNTSYLRSINRVRSQFNVVNMSDITTANGKALDERFLLRQEVRVNINQYKWPENTMLYKMS